MAWNDGFAGECAQAGNGAAPLVILSEARSPDQRATRGSPGIDDRNRRTRLRHQLRTRNALDQTPAKRAHGQRFEA